MMAVSRDRASDIAISALIFLARDLERFGRFLTLTGLGPDELAESAASPDFQGAVLSYLLDDESLLLVFAAEAGIAPAEIGPASLALFEAGGDEW